MDPTDPAFHEDAQPKRVFLRVDHARERSIYCRAVQVTIETILSASLRVSAESLNSPKRGSQAVVLVRHIAMYLAHVEGQLTLTETGQLFARDRRGVAYAVARLEQRREADPGFDRAVDQWGDAVRRHLGNLETYLAWTRHRV